MEEIAQLELGETTSLAGLQGLEGEWRALLAESPCLSPFQSPDWLLPWAEAFAPQALLCVTAHRAGRLAGLAPFYVHAPPRGVRQLTLLGNGVSDRLDLICAPRDGDGFAVAVLDHLARRPGWDVADLRDLPADSPLARAPAAPAWREEAVAEEPCPVAALPRDPALLTDQLSRSRRTDLRRCRRRLEAAGPVTIETADDGSRAEVLEALARFDAARAAQRGGPGALEDVAVQAFHEAATRRLLAAGCLRLHVLKVGGRAIAAHYALVLGDRGYSYLHGFDPAFAASGPGALLLAHAMADAIRCGAVTFDFLRGREPYKYDWGASDRAQVRRCFQR